MKLTAITLSACFILISQGRAADVVTVGVRSDAMGMAHSSSFLTDATISTFPGPLEGNGFDGYITYICDSALLELQTVFGAAITIRVEPLLASEVFPALQEGNVDIVCGPTTATKKRLASHISSPPVFVSGITYAQRFPATEWQACGPLVGAIEGSTSGMNIISTIAQSGHLGEVDGKILEDFRRNSESWRDHYTRCAEAPDAPVRYYKSHSLLANAFCAGEVKYYIGDFEIVALNLQAHGGLDSECGYEISDRMFSEERYVILGNLRQGNPEKIKFLATFFEILARQIFFQPSVLDEAFEDTFGEAKESRKLQLLYWALRGSSQN